MPKITIDPVTRVEGHLKVAAQVERGTVKEAQVGGQLFRDFENILVGRHPWDAVRLTQRICGVCPISHAVAATKAVEASLGYQPSDQALLMRALMQGGNFLQDHILHFYHLSLMDYIVGPGAHPWKPAYYSDMRLDLTTTDTLIKHYVQALDVRRKGQEMVAIFAGRVPHIASIHPGGVTKTPTADEIHKFHHHLGTIRKFIAEVYLPDVEIIAAAYPDYAKIGKGPEAVLSFGAFDLPGGSHLFRPGFMVDGDMVQSAPSVASVTEDVRYSRYSSASQLNPGAGQTVPQIAKQDAYSFIKAPRYDQTVVEVGPFARMRIAGRYKGPSSVIDRMRARAIEAQLIGQAMEGWITALKPDVSPFLKPDPIPEGSGVGTTEAPRGTLLHFLQYADDKATRYQVVTPTCWNASPRDDKGRPGAVERALKNARVADASQPIELLRIVHSFDPCTGCAVHVTEAGRTLPEAFVVDGPGARR